MERARPEDAPRIEEMNDDPLYDLEMVQLEAFEEGLDEWWTIKDEYELDERLEERDSELNGAETGDVVGEGPQVATASSSRRR